MAELPEPIELRSEWSWCSSEIEARSDGESFSRRTRRRSRRPGSKSSCLEEALGWVVGTVGCEVAARGCVVGPSAASWGPLLANCALGRRLHRLDYLRLRAGSWTGPLSSQRSSPAEPSHRSSAQAGSAAAGWVAAGLGFRSDIFGGICLGVTGAILTRPAATGVSASLPRVMIFEVDEVGEAVAAAGLRARSAGNPARPPPRPRRRLPDTQNSFDHNASDRQMPHRPSTIAPPRKSPISSDAGAASITCRGSKVRINSRAAISRSRTDAGPGGVQCPCGRRPLVQLQRIRRLAPKLG